LLQPEASMGDSHGAQPHDLTGLLASPGARRECDRDLGRTRDGLSWQGDSQELRESKSVELA